MKMTFLFSILFTFTNAFASNVDLTLTGADYVALLNVTGRSCGLQVVSWKTGPDDLAPVKALIGSLHMRWVGPSPLTLVSMHVIFDGSGIKSEAQSILLSEDEMKYLWTGDNTSAEVSGSRSSTPFCYFMVGGVAVEKTNKYFEGSGSIVLRGTYVDQGMTIPIESVLPFGYHFTPIPSPSTKIDYDL